MLYNLLNHQSVMQTQLLKITMKSLNTLSLIHVQTGKLVISIQKLVRGDMPPELVTSQMLAQALEEIDELSVRNWLQFYIPISST